MKLDEHPTVRRFHENASNRSPSPTNLDAAWLRQLCLDCGADDAGLVEISRPALDDQRDDILRVFPATKTLLSFVCRMNREPIRSTARSVANLEFHHTGDHVNEVARKIVSALEKKGVRALNPAMGFPMEMDRFPGGKTCVHCKKRKRRFTSLPVRMPRIMWHVRFPHKTIKRVGNGLRPRTIQTFLSGLRLVFQPGKAAKLNAVYHFTFTGKEEKQATVTIREGTLKIQDGHQGEADLRVTTDSETWLGFLARERSLLWALLRRKIKIKGSPKLLIAFGKCFPS